MSNDALHLPVVQPRKDDLAAAITALALRYRRANGPLMMLVNGLGGKIENRLEALPDTVKTRIEALAETALHRCYALAGVGRAGPDMGAYGHRAVASLSGAAGGFGGLATSVAELPLTVALIFRAIQKVAESHGLDPDASQTRAECLRVFGAGSPLAQDDGVNTGFLGARLTLTGPALNGLIARVAPRLATAMSQKLAAQAVPLLGAVTGAGINYAFMGYYTEMAHVRFGLLALSDKHDPATIMANFARAAQAPVVTRS